MCFYTVVASGHIVATDDLGQSYLVFPEDPGWAAARALYNLGVREIVLPRATLLTGELVDIAIPDMVSWSMDNEAVARLLRRYVRLADCMRYLNEHQ